MRSILLALICLFILAAATPASDLYRDPPAPEVFTRILTRGAVSKTVETLYHQARKIERQETLETKTVRRIQALIAILACTDRRVDADFLAGRLLNRLHKARPRPLAEIARVHNLMAFIRLGSGFRERGEKHFRLAIGYGNRIRSLACPSIARDTRVLSALLRALHYPYLAKIADDQAKAFENTVHRRQGGIRLIREPEVHDTQVPAMTFRMLKDELLKVDSARAALEEGQSLLPQMRAFAIQEGLQPDAYFAGEERCLKLTQELSDRFFHMKDFLFQLRRSNDHQVVDVREANLEDFRTLWKDLGGLMEELLANILIARLNNGL